MLAARTWCAKKAQAQKRTTKHLACCFWKKEECCLIVHFVLLSCLSAQQAAHHATKHCKTKHTTKNATGTAQGCTEAKQHMMHCLALREIQMHPLHFKKSFDQLHQVSFQKTVKERMMSSWLFFSEALLTVELHGAVGCTFAFLFSATVSTTLIPKLTTPKVPFLRTLSDANGIFSIFASEDGLCFNLVVSSF